MKRPFLTWHSFLLFLHLLCTPFFDAHSTQKVQEDLHIYLLIGQSNMAGRAKALPEDTAPIPNCFLLNGKNQWEVAAVGFNRYSSVKKKNHQGINPGYTFAKDILAHKPNIQLGIVCNARGTTGIMDWVKRKKELRLDAVKRTKIAMQSGTLKGILWLQGWNDRGSDDVGDYLDNLEKLVSFFRTEFEDETLPFIVGQLNQLNPAETGAFNAMILEAPHRIPFCDYVSSDSAGTIDNAHYSREGQFILGSRYAEKIIHFNYGASSPTSLLNSSPQSFFSPKKNSFTLETGVKSRDQQGKRYDGIGRLTSAPKPRLVILDLRNSDD